MPWLCNRGHICPDEWKTCKICKENPIIHKKLRSHYMAPYLCNQAVKPNPAKQHYHWKKVTCKNCLKQWDLKGDEDA